jgi:hypothetical protein
MHVTWRKIHYIINIKCFNFKQFSIIIALFCCFVIKKKTVGALPFLFYLFYVSKDIGSSLTVRPNTIRSG